MTARRNTETAKYWHDPALGNLELLHASFVTHHFAPHTHDGFAIGVIEAGAETFTYRNQFHVAPAGSIVLINPGEMHTGEALSTEDGWRYRMLYPDTSILQRAASEAAGRSVGVPMFPQAVVRDAHLSQLLVNLHASIEANESYLVRESRLIWTMAQLVVRFADGSQLMARAQRDDDVVMQARDYLTAHFHEGVTLAQLADVANMSAFHLLRVFRQTLGLPPHAYQTQLRVARAKLLLREGMPIADAAARVGFSDQSHLNRHFKRIVGVTPGQYVAGSPSPSPSRFTGGE